MSRKYQGIEGNIIEDVFGMTEEAIEMLKETEYEDILKDPEYKPTPVEKILIDYFRHLVFDLEFSREEALNLMDVKAASDNVIITGREHYSLIAEKKMVIEDDTLTVNNECRLNISPSLNVYKVVAMLLFLEENGYRVWEPVKVCEALQGFVGKKPIRNNEYEIETIDDDICKRLCAYYDGLTYEERSLVDCFLGSEDTGHLIMKKLGGFLNLVAVKKRICSEILEIIKG